jgi:hypothetical protein
MYKLQQQGKKQEKIYKTNERIITSQAAGELIHIDTKNDLYPSVLTSTKNYYLSTITDDYNRFILDDKLTETENIDENIKLFQNSIPIQANKIILSKIILFVNV